MFNPIRFYRLFLLLLCLLPGCSSREDEEAKLKDFANKTRNEFLEPFEEHKYESFIYDAPAEETFVLIYRVVRTKDGKLCYPVIIRQYPGYTGAFGGVESYPGISRLCDPCSNAPFRMIIPLSDQIDQHIYFIHGEGKRGHSIDENSKWYVFETPAPINGPVQIPNIKDLKLLSEMPEYQQLLDKMDEAEARMKPSKQ